MARRINIVLGALLLVGVIAFYLPTRHFHFVNLDDSEYIYLNPHVSTGFSVENLGWAFTSLGYSSNWHPLTWMSLMLDATLADGVEGAAELPEYTQPEDPVFDRLARVAHLHNILLHAVNAVLLYFVMLIIAARFGGVREDRPISLWDRVTLAALALLWAVHPLRAEVVCWCSERKELLAVAFMLLTVILYCSAARRPHAVRTINRSDGTIDRSGWTIDRSVRTVVLVGLSLLTFVFALLSKPVAVTLPVVLFLCDVILGRRFWAAARRVAPFALLSAASCVVTLAAQRHAVVRGEVVPFLMRAADCVQAPIWYLRDTILPTKLCAFYPVNFWVGYFELYAGLALVLALGAVSVWWLISFRRAGGVTLLDCAVLGVGWCWVGFLPMSGLVHAGSQSHADRYTYWIGAGLCVMAALAVVRFARRRAAKLATLGALAIACGAYGWAGRGQCETWRDTKALYENAWRKCPSGFTASTLAQLYGAEGDNERAKAFHEAAIELTPQDDTWSAYALFLAANGTAKDAPQVRELAGKALKMNPRCVSAYEAMGLAYYRERKAVECERYLSKAVGLGSFNGSVHDILHKIRLYLQGGGK